MIVCFVSGQKPLSIQAQGLNSYKQRLVQEFCSFKSIYPNLPINESIYSKVIYIHSDSSYIDVDNMSKPFIDAFKGVIYPDDNIINHRICSKIKFDDFESYEFQLELIPIEIAEKLDYLIANKNPHILYFEIGLFSPNMVFFGGVKDES
jgi:hypothetical protein